MISIRVYVAPDGKVFGFDADNHCDKQVCSAVSMLVINTANSIELLTDEDFTLELDENGGYFRFRIDEPYGHDAELLLQSLYLGLSSIAEEYPEELSIEEITGTAPCAEGDDERGVVNDKAEP